MIKLIPLGPWQNPPLAEGVYNATLHQLSESTYGSHDDPMLRFVFHLPDAKAYCVTHLYFPGGFSIRSQNRLWHFCQAVGTDQQEAIEQPETLNGRKLRLYIHTVHPTQANYGHPYCDVKYFLPADGDDKKEQPESEDS